MRIKVLGTRGEIEETASNIEKHSGVLIDKLLFDCGEDSFLKYSPKAIFVTHIPVSYTHLTLPTTPYV